MGMPYPQAPYQPAYPYGDPAMGYQMQYPYPQMPMNYPGMYPQMGPPMGMYPPAAPTYAPPASQPAGLPEPETGERGYGIRRCLNVRLPDPKTTGAKAPPPPPAPQPAPAPQAAAPPAGEENPLGAAAKSEEQKQAPPVKPSEGAADILKKYTQRRPV